MVAAVLSAAVPLLATAVPAAVNAYNNWKNNQQGNQMASNLPASQLQHIAKGTANDPAVIANALANAQQGTQQGSYFTNPDPSWGALANSLAGAMTGGPSSMAVSPTGQIVANPLQLGISQLAQQALVQPQQQQMQEHINQVGRAQVNRVQQNVDPQLQAISRQLEERKTQIAATDEHRRIMAREKRWARLDGELRGIRRAIGDRERY